MKTILILSMTLFVLACSKTTLLSQSTEQPSAVEFIAHEHFTTPSDSDYSFYYDEYRQVFAINAGNPKLRDRFIRATKKLDSNFIGGEYLLTLNTITEEDGESSYQVFVNDELIATVTNPETHKAFKLVQLQIGKTELKAGDVLTIAANAVTNGKIPEGDGTAYARGRWQSLLLTPVQ
ncbi:hypothetical protein [Catenovulum sediminis]|uniref:hypothetical protein n=1 Tax=Catenovulum sediminis TaxID=1740262 RepID=UPI001181094A|nr:hypothetical protein [Catenovulum sediminis]